MGGIYFSAMLAGSLLLDAAVRPRAGRARQWQGWLLHSLVMAALFGLFLGGSGNVLVAALLALAFMALAMVVSNAKHAMLGEPLLFSDLALVAAVFRHPRFYLTALSVPQRILIGLGAALLVLALGLTIGLRWELHAAGLALFTAASGAILIVARRLAQLTPSPAVHADVARFGLLATISLYWSNWRATPDPLPCPAEPICHAELPDVIVIVQCESFADPVSLTGDTMLTLPGLERARNAAWQWGELGVSGFGAYTMRTEYGVLFGRSEEALGFRSFDPFLTALTETSHALPARLAPSGYRSLFVHPHDMRFYGRNRLMPAAGFAKLIGEEGLPPVTLGSRYLDDPALGVALAELSCKAAEPLLLYAVTMGNHGPWIRDPITGSEGGLGAYMQLVRESDAMLAGLIDSLSAARRPTLLVFFGDHRPSIPGVTRPGGDRHTPYVMIRLDADGQAIRGDGNPVNLTPAELHHAILGGLR
jgi:hypothetical protein